MKATGKKAWLYLLLCGIEATAVTASAFAETTLEKAKFAELSGNLPQAEVFFRSTIKDGSPDEARRATVLLTDLFNQKGRVNAAIAVLEDYLKNNDAFDRDLRIQLVHLLIQSESFEAAHKNLAVLEKLRTTDSQPKILKADIFYAEAKYSKAYETLEEAASLDSLPIDYYILKGSILNALNRYSEALSAISVVTAIDRKNPQAAVVTAEALAGESNKPQALATLDAINKDSLTSIDWHIRVAKLYDQLGEYRAARDAYGRALKFGPTRVDLAIDRAHCSIALKDWDTATDELTAWAKRYPNHDKLAFWTSKVYSLTKRYDEAGKVLREFYKRNPTSEWAAIAYSKTLVLADQLDLAGSVLKNCLAANPDAVDVAIELSHVKLLDGRAQEAVALLVKYSKAYPDNDYLKVALGKTFSQIGSRDEAKRYLAQVSTTNTDAHSLASKTLEEISSAPLPSLDPEK